MMCQARKTYGGRQSEMASRVQPGHVPADMEDIFYMWTLNTSLSDILSINARLFQPVCMCACICARFVHMAKERRILKMISVAHKEEASSASLAMHMLSCSSLRCQSLLVYKFTVFTD